MKMSRSFKTTMLHVAGSVVAIFLAFAVGGLLMLMIDVNPFLVYGTLIDGVLLNPYGVAQIFFKATPLILAGLSVAFAFKAGLFNIGAEGQMMMGGFLCALVGFSFMGLPVYVHVPLCIMAAILGGVAWAAVPGILKAKTGAHEVITTIMMNFIAAALTNYFVTMYFHEPETVHTAAISPSAILPRLDSFISTFKGSPANASFFIALLACIVVFWMLWKMPLGFEIRAVGMNPDASATSGIGVNRNTIIAFLVAGGLAGLGGINFVMGYKHYFEEGFTSGVGFMGIAVALLGQNNPIGVIMAALLFGALSHGTLVINSLVPKDIVLVLQALVIIFVIVFNNVTSRYAREIMDDK